MNSAIKKFYPRFLVKNIKKYIRERGVAWSRGIERNKDAEEERKGKKTIHGKERGRERERREQDGKNR